MKKNLAYCLLPLAHTFTAIGCYILSEWEEKAELEEKVFREFSYNNVFTAVATALFYPFGRRCQQLLSNPYVYKEEEVQSHILNSFTSAGTILAPAAFLFAESAGCLNAHGETVWKSEVRGALVFIQPSKLNIANTTRSQYLQGTGCATR